jgi:hypothetical protein
VTVLAAVGVPARYGKSQFNTKLYVCVLTGVPENVTAVEVADVE